MVLGLLATLLPSGAAAQRPNTSCPLPPAPWLWPRPPCSGSSSWPALCPQVRCHHTSPRSSGTARAWRKDLETGRGARKRAPEGLRGQISPFLPGDLGPLPFESSRCLLPAGSPAGSIAPGRTLPHLSPPPRFLLEGSALLSQTPPWPWLDGVRAHGTGLVGWHRGAGHQRPPHIAHPLPSLRQPTAPGVSATPPS